MMIPDPIPGITSADLRAALVGGLVGQCVMCAHGSIRWVDVVALGGRPVADGSGHLTDHVALHGTCCEALISFWTTLDDDGPGDVTLPDVGPVAHAREPEDRPAVPPTRLPRLGAYAQR